MLKHKALNTAAVALSHHDSMPRIDANVLKENIPHTLSMRLDREHCWTEQRYQPLRSNPRVALRQGCETGAPGNGLSACSQTEGAPFGLFVESRNWQEVQNQDILQCFGYVLFQVQE